MSEVLRRIMQQRQASMGPGGTQTLEFRRGRDDQGGGPQTLEFLRGRDDQGGGVQTLEHNKGWLPNYQQGRMPTPTGAQFSPDDVLSATADMQQGIAKEAERRKLAAESHANTDAWLNQNLPQVQATETGYVPEPHQSYAGDQSAVTKSAAEQSEAALMAPRDGKPPLAVDPAARSRSAPARLMPLAGDPNRRNASDTRRANSNRTLHGGWGDAADAPLPGEETLPGSVAAWNQQRASAGLSGGLDDLRNAYEVEMRQGDQSVAATAGLSFEEWLHHHGVTEDLPPHEAGNRLNEMLSRNLSQFPDHKAPGKDPRLDADDDTILQGRRGVADNTPLDLMTPEQRERIGSNRDGVPRTARGGYHVWDETQGEAGGFVPRGFDVGAAQKALASGNVRQAADALGIDHRAYGDNLAQLEADVHRVAARQTQLAENYDTAPVPGGGTRLRANANMKGKMDDMRARQWGQTMARRYARELKDDNISIGDMQSMYRSYLNRNPGDYDGAGRFMNAQYLDALKARQTQNRWLSVQQSADQYNRSRRYGVSQGLVSFFDSLNSAKTPEERQALLMFAHGAHPHMGWNSLAAMYAKGQFDDQALQHWAAQMGNKQNPSEQIGAAVNNFVNAPAGMATWAQINHHASSMPGAEKMSPELKRGEARRYAMPIVQNAIQSGNYNTPDQIAFIRAVTEDAPGQPAAPDTFAAVTGVPRNDPRFGPLYQHVFGVPPTNGFGENLYAAGAAGVQTASDIANWLSRAMGGGINPSAYAMPLDPAAPASR